MFGRMNAKLQAIVASSIAGVAGFVNWLATVPPEQQSGLLAQMVEITPVQYRPTVGVITRFATLFLGVYASYQAAHSGTQKPPNP